MRYAVILSLSLLTLNIGVASAEPLNVKPGLWETTTTIEKKRAKQPTNLDQLTPEQRIRVEAQLAHQTKRETHTVNACLSEAKIRTGEAFTGNTHRGACNSEFKTQTDSTLEASVQCRGANQLAGTVTMNALDPEHMHGTVDMTYGPADRLQLATHSEITSRWLQAGCSKNDQ
jgi:hypothetical protein